MTKPYPVDIVDRARVVEVEEDICATCGHEAKVQAFVYARMRDGSSIALCGHHGTESWERLHEQAVEVIDFRWRLTQQDLAEP
jgi:hypothetical protein